MEDPIPLYRPHLTGREAATVAEAIHSLHWAGNGPFTRRCQEVLARMTGTPAFLTPTGTDALEVVALALNASPGDEVIVPSYTFTATATCLLQAGLTPVFVDVREDTVNLDESLIEPAITPRTRAVIPVHYAGVAAEMDTILAVARRHGLAVIEDAAQGVNSYYRGRPLGTLGDLGILSFHQTKNASCGEGGAVLVRNGDYLERVEIHHEVGTDRLRFLRGEVPQYSWVDRGSNYLLSDILAAFLLPQLEAVAEITDKRRPVYHRYLDRLRPLEQAGWLRLPVVPPECQSNYQSFHVLVDSVATRNRLQAHLKAAGVGSGPHYVPLHATRGSRRFGTVRGPLKVADMVGDCLLRLPFYTAMTDAEQDRVIDAILTFYSLRVSR